MSSTVAKRRVMRSIEALLPGAAFEHDRLLTPEQALIVYRAALPLVPLGTETIALGTAFGRILALDAVAGEMFPPQPRSTMDGFAVRSSDGLAPRRLAGEVRMGQAPPGPLAAGQAMAIPTGGILPPGSDAVVPLEDAELDGEIVRVRSNPAAGDCFTPAGSDMAPGDVVIRAGRRIGAAEMGVLATLGTVRPTVYRRPCFAVISTGDELIDAGSVPAIGQVRDSNRWAIAGALAAMGADVLQLPNAPDALSALQLALAAGLAQADGVVLTGGSSVGERDLTPEVIGCFDGPGVIVHGLRVKPGKPTVLAAVGSKPVIGLPGNPTSALMILEAVCAPIVHALTGQIATRPVSVRTVAGATFRGRTGWTWYVPAELRDPDQSAFPLTIRSAHTSLLARAAGYVVLSAERPVIEAGEPVAVVRLGGAG